MLTFMEAKLQWKPKSRVKKIKTLVEEPIAEE